MKKILLVFIGLYGLFLPSLVKAQCTTFAVVSDTVHFTFSTNTGTPYDNIINLTGANLTLQWEVVSTDMPNCWLGAGAFGICDNSFCRYNTDDTLWSNVTETGHSFTSTYPFNSTHNDTGGFNLALNLDSCVGCHYVTIKFKDLTSGCSQTVTYELCLPALSVPTLPMVTDNIVIYPNPATSDLNVVYDANADVKTIAIYSIIGKIMKVYKVSGNSANLNLDNVPSGIYFVRLMNSHGDPVVTRKFTKQ